VLSVLSHPAFAGMFEAGTRAEVPIVGRLPRDGRASLTVSGQVDRLAVTPAEGLIAGYKTGRAAPRAPTGVPQADVTQLALYRAVLRRIYPDRVVRAALVWTAVPELMEVPKASLEAALAAL